MPGVLDTGWLEQFCPSCRQVTWHLNGLCSNREFHLSTTATSLSLPAELPTPPAKEPEEAEDDEPEAAEVH